MTLPARIHFGFSIIRLSSVQVLDFPIVRSSDYSVRSSQNVGRNRQADLLRCLEIDHQFKLHGLLHGKVGWLGSFQEPVYIVGGATVQSGETGPDGAKRGDWAHRT
jgi:hypothetical protein